MKAMRNLLLVLAIGMPLSGHALTYAQQIAAVTQEKEQAETRVKAIVNQPVQSYPFNSYSLVQVVSPGWFHAGAITPDYTADVRKTQEFPYDKANYVTSDVSPGVMYKSGDLEFNKMLKFYYTDKNIPKKRLSNAEMVEINALYRTIGDDTKKLADMQEFMPSTEAGLMEFFNSPAGTAVELLILSLVGFVIYKKKFA